jgi:hypothetical protein
MVHCFDQSRKGGDILQTTSNLRAKSAKSAFGGANPSIFVRFYSVSTAMPDDARAGLTSAAGTFRHSAISAGQRSIGVRPSVGGAT